MKRSTISRTKMKSRVHNKTNPTLVDTLSAALKSPAWNEVAKKLSGPTRRQPSLNLFQIDSLVKAGDTIVLPGKILSQGDLTKKIKLCALSISSLAKEKIKKSKSEFVPLIEEIKKNQKAEGIKILP